MNLAVGEVFFNHIPRCQNWNISREKFLIDCTFPSTPPGLFEIISGTERSRSSRQLRTAFFFTSPPHSRGTNSPSPSFRVRTSSPVQSPFAHFSTYPFGFEGRWRGSPVPTWFEALTHRPPSFAASFGARSSSKSEDPNPRPPGSPEVKSCPHLLPRNRISYSLLLLPGTFPVFFFFFRLFGKEPPDTEKSAVRFSIVDHIFFFVLEYFFPFLIIVPPFFLIVPFPLLPDFLSELILNLGCRLFFSCLLYLLPVLLPTLRVQD